MSLRLPQSPAVEIPATDPDDGDTPNGRHDGDEDLPRRPQFVDKTGRTLLVRRTEPADEDRLVDLYESFADAHRAQGLPPSTTDRTERWLATVLEEGVNFVADLGDDGGLVGHSFYTPATHAEPELAVFVHPEYHDRGIGTELCKHVVAMGATTDRDAIVLEVEHHNRAATHIYRKLGFETVHGGRELFMRRSLEDGDDAFRRSAPSST